MNQNKPTAPIEDVYDVSKNPRTNTLYGYLNKAVTIIGLGGGGEIALHLARSGVRRLNLIDFDTLEVGNLVRHACGSKHIGQNKAEAVRDMLAEYNPASIGNILAYNWDIFKHREEFQEIVSGSDVVIIATDTDSSRLFINDVCVETKTPAIFVTMFPKGMGGQVFAYLPGNACYACFVHYEGRQGFIQKYVDTLEKTDCSSERDVRSMPGLGIDQSFLSAIASRKTLDILLLDQKHSLKSLGDKNRIIWSLTGLPGALNTPLSSARVNVPKHEDCYSCGKL